MQSIWNNLKKPIRLLNEKLIINNQLNQFQKYYLSTTFNLFASNSNNNDEKTTGENSKSDNLILTEQLPPIPPNYGYVGDENIYALHEINRIRKSFRYGYLLILDLF